MRNKHTISIYPNFYIEIALAIFLLPLPLVLGWIAAVALHELCHVLMMKLLRINILSVHIGARGTVIKTESMTPIQELLCSLAGPIGGLLPIVILRWVPLMALCTAIHSAYNLLPVYPLDGGRALRCVLNCIVGANTANLISQTVSYCVIAVVLFTGVALLIHFRLGLLPLVFLVLSLISNALKNSLQSRRKNSTI